MEQMLIGIICAPELPRKITENIIDDLSTTFSQSITDNVEWKIEYQEDLLTGAAEKVDEIFEAAERIKQNNNWQYVICLTDLPIYSTAGDIVLADLNIERGIAQISLPAFGFPPMQARLKKVILQMMVELYKDESFDKKEYKQNLKTITRSFPLSPVRRIKPKEKEEKVDSRYIVHPRVNGEIRLISGMTIANRPWLLITSFKPIIAVAFATGAYSIIFTTLWKLSVHFSLIRLISLMLVSIASMVLWITLSHNLWETSTTKGDKKIKHLYNMATITTLTIGVVTFYSLLFIIFSIAILIFVPPDMFQSVTSIKEEVDALILLRLSWLGTSVAILAGAIGAGVENPELVRNIAYGYRQKQRYNEIENL